LERWLTAIFFSFSAYPRQVACYVPLHPCLKELSSFASDLAPLQVHGGSHHAYESGRQAFLSSFVLLNKGSRSPFGTRLSYTH